MTSALSKPAAFFWPEIGGLVVLTVYINIRIMSIIYLSKVIVSVPKSSWHNVLNKKIPSFSEKIIYENRKALQ